MSNFITITSDENKIKLKNLLYVGVLIGFVWILFHFTIIFFFGLVLESILLVGLFLGIGNLVALFLDIPIGVLQKYVKAKYILVFGASLMIFVSFIFLKFIYFEGISDILPSPDQGMINKTISVLGTFLNSSLNILLLLLAACLYGIIKESFDVTVLSYIFNNSTPGEYANIISKYNICVGAGTLVGLVFSGILLAMYIKIAVIIFIIITVGFLIFILKYFDNTKESMNFQGVKNIRLDIIKNDFLNKQQEMIGKITTKNLIELSRKSKVILLKPLEIKKEINFQEMYRFSLQSFQNFFTILFRIPRNIIILWFVAIILQYGFWDTFVGTFQVEFLQKIMSLNQHSYLISQTKGIVNGYLILGILVIPAFVFQNMFINLSEKKGVFKVILFGFLISSLSLISFAFVENIYLIIFFGFCNSIGYAATMPLAQAMFSSLYNEEYAKKFHLKEIDSTISAAPLKIVLNSANVIGLLIGAFLVRLLGFNNFFLVFGGTLFVFFIFSFLKMRKKMSEFHKDEKTSENLDADFV